MKGDTGMSWSTKKEETRGHNTQQRCTKLHYTIIYSSITTLSKTSIIIDQHCFLFCSCWVTTVSATSTGLCFFSLWRPTMTDTVAHPFTCFTCAYVWCVWSKQCMCKCAEVKCLLLSTCVHRHAIILIQGGAPGAVSISYGMLKPINNKCK